LLYAAFFGLFIHPTPFLPYPGISAFLMLRFARPVVLARKERFSEGVLNPNFITYHLFIRCTDRAA